MPPAYAVPVQVLCRDSRDILNDGGCLNALPPKTPKDSQTATSSETHPAVIIWVIAEDFRIIEGVDCLNPAGLFPKILAFLGYRLFYGTYYLGVLKWDPHFADYPNGTPPPLPNSNGLVLSEFHVWEISLKSRKP